MLYVNQYDNLGNINAHRETGREIWKQINGKKLKLSREKIIFITGVGTGGNLIGVADFLKEMYSNIEVYSLHPDDDIPGIQGLQPLINGEVESNIFKANKHLIDGNILVSAEEAYQHWKWLLNNSLMVGLSSGANLAGIPKKIKTENIKEGTIITIFPDHSDRYKHMNVKRYDRHKEK